ncbi:uncharacterized protein FIESC28_02977 [Fusarium coffeatum]|uniref:ABC transporter domain-containing protein n=1 Tax=Fusarium coffeatum TaxID=231269 RepID=A0A366S4J9_9HYPO|nr:uncharacterized protein FIESC28_02977 [Fusarium coffeatum]RBR24244.1 hypothetical protein FIESC28_02977 [Fusarium coffeatum]
MSQTLLLSLGSVTLAVSLLSCSVALQSAFTQSRNGKARDQFYEDADGCASPETLAKFTNKVSKGFVIAISAIGVGASIAGLASATLHHGSVIVAVLNVATWVLAFVHGICIAIQHSPVIAHKLGILLLFTALALTVSSLFRLSHLFPNQTQAPTGAIVLTVVNTLFAVALTFASTCLPRRPDVFHKNVAVDRQYSTSLLGRLTWTWIQPLLRHAAQQQDLDTKDVPQADSRLRSQELKKQWNQQPRHGSLIRYIIALYKGRLFILWIATLVRCAVSILPFWFMLKIINVLEDRTTPSDNMKLMVFVLGMAFSNMLDSWMEGWAYCKVLLRKNIRTAGGDDSVSESDATSEEDETSLKSHQAIVNLVGIDTERLFYFLQYHFLILAGIVKLIIFSFFLLRILGWLPLIGGIVAWALTLPFNTWFSGKVLTESRTLMRHRDVKLSKISEVLTGLRQIKFCALEAQWEQRILALRNAELATLWKFFLADSGLFACWVISPILLAVAALTTYVLVHGTLLPSVAFVSIGIFNTLETTLGSLPELFTLGLDSLVSLRRISTYLDEPEKQTELLVGDRISFHNASVAWPSASEKSMEGDFALSKLSLSFPNHVLSVVSGKVGTGKTLLLSAILGEADLLSGSIYVPKKQPIETRNWIIPGSVAYVSETPWLENASIRDNILFGLPMDKSRYKKVLDACALTEDLSLLQDGDDTEIGANGVNLSGGQKWRVTLARAVYSRAEILLMEDIFSAVDSHVGASIYDGCLTGDICHGRTRIIVTHHLGLVMPGASFYVELGEGGVLYSGPPKSQFELSDDQLDLEVLSADTQDTMKVDHGSHSFSDRRQSSVSTTVGENQPSKSEDAPKKFMQEETRQKGNVKGGVYLAYVKGSGGTRPWMICIAVYLAYQAGTLGRAWILRIWTARSSAGADGIHHVVGSTVSTQQLLYRSFAQIELDPDVLFYLKLYIAISVATATVGILRYLSSYYLAVRASKSLFERMLFAVMHAPLRWLDTVHTGRILNRFTADFNIIDERIALSWSMFFSHLLRLVSICIASCFASVYLIPPAVVLLAIGAVIGNRYLIASRPLKRLESNAKSPVFELFNTTLAGIATIRVFRKTQTYLEQMHSNLNAWTMTTFYIALANRWMSFRMALITALFSITVGIVIIAKSIDAALAGLALSFILDFSESLRWTIRSYGDMELEMNSMERVVEYMNLETEYLGGLNAAAAWPSSASLEAKDLEVAYSSDLPPVLKGLSFKIRHGERVGVVGRTGAGKSSLTLALFRFLEARSGSIAIDGVDISMLKLTDLRSKMSIIPQHPVLFSGTIRSNLDPFGEYTDIQLYEALVRVHLIGQDDTSNSSIFNDLSSPIAESGSNLSQGQQQLLCIARALLAASKIIVLDEATSAIDMATDVLIQKSIREWFTDRTMIVIAHRLSTVADFDKVLVLDGGRMVEFGTPRELWEKDGAFRRMCTSAGDSEEKSLRRVIMG